MKDQRAVFGVNGGTDEPWCHGGVSFLHHARVSFLVIKKTENA
jgi:hypothetical protein